MRTAIGIILLCHLATAFIYLYFKGIIELKPDILLYQDITVADMFALCYFGPEWVFTGLFILFACSNNKTWLETQLCWVEAGFILIRTIIYILHYSHLLHTGSIQRISFIVFYLLLSSIIIVVSGWRNGYFKRKY